MDHLWWWTSPWHDWIHSWYTMFLHHWNSLWSSAAELAAPQCCSKEPRTNGPTRAYPNTRPYHDSFTNWNSYHPSQSAVRTLQAIPSEREMWNKTNTDLTLLGLMMYLGLDCMTLFVLPNTCTTSSYLMSMSRLFLGCIPLSLVAYGFVINVEHIWTQYLCSIRNYCKVNNITPSTISLPQQNPLPCHLACCSWAPYKFA